MLKVENNNYKLEDEFKNVNNVANSERMEIVFGEDIPDWEDSLGGVFRFAKGDYAQGDPLSVDKVELLEEKGFISFKQYHNYAPSIGELVEKAENINKIAPDDGECRLIGYVVPPERNDCRITVEGARYDGKVTELISKAFKEEFGTGYEFSESDNHLRRWHD